MDRDEAMIRFAPRHCPGCGTTSLNIETLLGDDNHLVFDTYCKTCGWSGDISPDKAVAE